jgi:hypothetical protein
MAHEKEAHKNYVANNVGAKEGPITPGEYKKG